MLKDTSCGCGKDVSLFKKGQIIGMYQAEKASKEIAETTVLKLGSEQSSILIKTVTS